MAHRRLPSDFRGTVTEYSWDLTPGVGSELVGGGPTGVFFERGGVGVLFGWGDPVHEAGCETSGATEICKAGVDRRAGAF